MDYNSMEVTLINNRYFYRKCVCISLLQFLQFLQFFVIFVISFQFHSNFIPICFNFIPISFQTFQFQIIRNDNKYMNIQLNNKIVELTNLIKEKNEIIAHLKQRIENQEKQIDMLVVDAEEKHFQEIKKYYAKSYEKYLKFGKYLLLRVDEVVGNGLYLPKGANIVHFAEIEQRQGQRGNLAEIEQRQGQRAQEPRKENPSAIQLKEKQSGIFENSVIGLSKEIEALSEKLKIYSAMAVKQPEDINELSVRKKTQVKEQGKLKQMEDAPQDPIKLKQMEDAPQDPIKKKNTKTIFIRR